VAAGAVLIGRCTIGVEGNGKSSSPPVSKPVTSVPAGVPEKSKPVETRRR